MSFSETEIRTLCAANTERSWPSVPDDVPQSIRRGIAESRAKKLGYKPAQATATDVTERLTAVEDQLRRERAQRIGALIATEK